MQEASFNTKALLVMPALICVLVILFFSNANLPFYVGEYYSGIISIYTMYPFAIFGSVGYLIYILVLITVLYKIGYSARTRNGGLFISGYIVLMVILDIFVYQLSNSSGITSLSLILEQQLDQYAIAPLLFMFFGIIGVSVENPTAKGVSAIFGATFIIANTIIVR